VSARTPAALAGLDAGRALVLVSALLDDTAVVPPGTTSTAEAVRAHRAHREAAEGLALGPLHVPVSVMGDLLDALDAQPESSPLDLVLVADTGLVEAAEARAVLLDDDRVDLAGLVLALALDGPLSDSARLTLDTLDFALPAALEVPLAPGWPEALAVLGADGAERAAIRVGGGTPRESPPDVVVAEFLVAAVHARLAFCVTGNVVGALRSEGADGAPQHGALNLLAGTAAALRWQGVPQVAALLAERSAAPLLAVLADADPHAVRRRLTSLATTDVGAAIADLRGLGLLVDAEL
jgi:hypothetical protein